MGLCNLAAEDQTNSRTTLFCREERHEKIRRVGDARAFIEHQDFEIGTVPGPSELYAATGFVRCVCGIAAL
jgi:hypothetical protein